MINSISQIESDKVKKFGDFTTKPPSQYWIMPAQSNNSIETKPQFQLSPKIIINPDEARKTKNLTIIGTSIAAATVLTAAGLFFFLKGGPRGLLKYSVKLKLALVRRLRKSKINNEDNTSFKNKAYVYMIKAIDSCQKKFEAVNNFTSFKDVLFKKIMFTTELGAKIHEGITHTFKNIGRRTVIGSYHKTSSKIYSLKNTVPLDYAGKTTSEFIYINGNKFSKKDALKLAENLNETLFTTYRRHFSSKAFENRYLEYKEVLKALKLNFAKLDVFGSKGVYSGFMAESVVHNERIAFQELVRAHRKELSYSHADMAYEVKNKVLKMTDLISYKDTDKIMRLKNISLQIKKYAKDPIANYEMKDKIISGIDELYRTVQESLNLKTIDASAAEKLFGEISEIRRIFVDFKQGQVEDILSIYRQLLPKDEFKKVEKTYKKAIRTLDKAIKIETEDYMSKMRDLALGSAPTDVLTILGSLIVLGYQLSKSNNNDQRMSISLKYGIPALAGIGTALYCNAKLYAGSKSLIFGTISTLLVNKLGVYADNARKKYMSNPEQTSSAVK